LTPKSWRLAQPLLWGDLTSKRAFQRLQPENPRRRKEVESPFICRAFVRWRLAARAPTRRLSLWHAAGVPARELAERAGHKRPSESLDTYSHIVPDDDDEWR
jgi:hypothetical protein